MTWGGNLFQNLLTVGILAIMALMIYLRVAGKTFIEFLKEIREVFSGHGGVDLYEKAKGGFSDIR